jgi:hypothetical protein
MTYYAPDKVPYDEWFDPDYKYEPHPYDNWPMATDKDKEVKEDDSMHEKMYKIATSKYNPFSVGGSEEWHDSKPG